MGGRWREALVVCRWKEPECVDRSLLRDESENVGE